MKLLQRSSLFFVLALLLLVPRNIFSCGPFFETATFSFDTHPDYPIADYLHGKLGILKPSFYRMYLFVAYRVLSGHPLTANEAKAIEPVLNREARSADSMTSYGFIESDEDASPAHPSASEQWLSARTRALDEPSPKQNAIDPHLNYADYQTFLNCPDAAFKTATDTLQDREQKWGAKSADVKTWIAGQDIVFAHCSKRDNTLPPEITTSNTLLKKDRDYQIAAALFYSGVPDQLLQAQQRFDEIGHDKLSPWKLWSPYLAARATIRAATLKSTQDKAFDEELMTKAEARLKAILNNRMFIPTYPACQQMLGYVEARLRPEERTREIAQRLSNGTSPDIAQDLIDYRYLLDNNVGNAANSPARGDDLTDWIRTFQSGAAGKDHALEKWRATQSHAWLVAALSATPAKDAAREELLAAASTVDPKDPHLLTVFYQRVLALRDASRDDDARLLIDNNLDYLAKDVPISSRNLFWSSRLALAQSFQEFLRFAPRENAEPPAGNNDQASRRNPDNVYFDTDSTAIFNRAIPLSMFVTAAGSAQLPKALQPYLAVAGWTRALLLNNTGVAAQLAPAVKDANPVLAPYVDEYAKAASDSDREHEVLWTLLHNPGLRPYVVPNMQRYDAVNEMDSLRDNWWCEDLGSGSETAFRNPNAEDAAGGRKPVPKLNPGFLSSEEKSAGAAEWSTLSKLGAAPNYMAAGVLRWAKASPDDPRIPEALHYVVRAGHLGCTDDHTRAFSKQAFQLLHGKYPNSEWTKKTPYYY